MMSENILYDVNNGKITEYKVVLKNDEFAALDGPGEKRVVPIDFLPLMWMNIHSAKKEAISQLKKMIEELNQ